MHLLRILAALILWTGLSAPAFAQTAELFGTALKGWAEANKVGKAEIVVRRGGKVVYSFAIGGLDPKQPVHLASLSKAITASCAATLVRDGKLTFETPLSVALAKFFQAHGKPADPRALAITIGQLITHRSGLGGKESKADPATGQNLVNYLGSHSAGVAPGNDYTALVLKSRLMRDPGAAYDYSNAGYQLLDSVIQEATGRPYAEYCREAVLLPLGSDGALDPTWAIMAAYGGWRLTPENYLRFLDIFDRANPLLGDAVKAYLFAPEGKTPTPGAASWYGLGVNLRRAGQGHNVWHWGEWRYRYNRPNGTSLLSDFNSFAVRAADGTEWFAYIQPAVADGAPKNDLDKALFDAYRAVRDWR